MKITLFTFLSTSVYLHSVTAAPHSPESLPTGLSPRASCENTATSRGCWGDYSIDIDYYTIALDTGVTRDEIKRSLGSTLLTLFFD
jgi:hypothetical protein